MSTGKPDFMGRKKDEEEDTKVGRPDFMNKKKEESEGAKTNDASVGRPDYMKDDDDDKRGVGSRSSPTEKVESEAKANSRPLDLSASDNKAAETDGKDALETKLGGTAAAETEYVAEHVVQAGDNLSYISRDYYGTKDHWKEIYEANKDVIKDPNVIRVGMVLKIPRLE